MGRWSAFGVAWAATAVSALMLLAPATSAASPGIVLHKPYNQFPSSSGVSIQNAGCASAKTIKTPSWSIKTGVFHGAGSVRAPPCKVSGTQESYSDWEGSFNFQGPFKFATNGSHLITVSWKAKWNISYNIPSYTCILNYNAPISECYTWADVFVFNGGQVFDETNFSQFNGGYTNLASFSGGGGNESVRTCTPVCNVSSVNTSFGPMSNSSVMSTTGSVAFNMSGAYAVANDSNTYDLYYTFIALIIVYDFTLNAKLSVPAVATAQANLGTLGNQLTIGSIVIN